MKRSICCLCFIGFAASAYGHHSVSWHFDPDVEITIEGVIKDFKLVNPHSRLLLDVADEQGQVVTWDCELGGRSGAIRNGWTQELFQPGQQIVITGFPARRHATECYFESGVLEDAAARLVEVGLLAPV